MCPLPHPVGSGAQRPHSRGGGEHGAVQARPSLWSSQTQAHPAAPGTSDESSSALFVGEAARKGARNGASLMINVFTQASPRLPVRWAHKSAS